VEDPATQVDVVTGATLTSNGVDAMLKEGLKPLKNYAIGKLIESIESADSINVESKAEEE
jgi:Na+-transporting NADH:ubiquinone oxidoreductase subunit C